MNRDYLRSNKGQFHSLRLLILAVTIVYINSLSCGMNSFGGNANMNSTSDSEFIHIIMWVAFAIDGFVYLTRIFEENDDTDQTSFLINCAFALIYFVAFVILLVSWIKCSNKKTLFCQGKHKCWVYFLPTPAAFALMILYIYPDFQRISQQF